MSAGAIAVVGAGSIGVAWAIVFATAGLAVALHDTDPERLAASRTAIRARLEDLAAHGLASDPVDAVLARIRFLLAILRGAIEGVEANAVNASTMTASTLNRHPGESRDPSFRQHGAATWIPAFAGMTVRRDDRHDEKIVLSRSRSGR